MSFAWLLARNVVRFVAGLPLPNRHYCCVCEARVAKFLPYMPTGLRPYRPPLFIAAMETIGSDTANFSCPRCGSHDRERHLLLYFRATGLLSLIQGKRILHLAPEKHISAIIMGMQPARYVMGDLYPGPGMELVDLQDIAYPAGSFDLVIANHVLEHVNDDIRALREIRRVLCEGGHAILQTPYSQALTCKFENSGISSGKARLQAYGQEDHVRLYGRDIFERFASIGLADRTIRHEEALPDVDALKYGVNPQEPFFLFQKPLSSGAKT